MFACLYWLNTLRPRQTGRHSPDDIFSCIFLNQNVWISLKISLKFVPKVRFDNIPALVQIMVWRRPGDKPLSEPMMVSLLTHLCVTRHRWVEHTLYWISSIFIWYTRSVLHILAQYQFAGHTELTTGPFVCPYVSITSIIKRLVRCCCYLWWCTKFGSTNINIDVQVYSQEFN